ncbi:hypothetical protein D3C87_2207210 [compost metagenome]
MSDVNVRCLTRSTFPVEGDVMGTIDRSNLRLVFLINMVSSIELLSDSTNLSESFSKLLI